jgi:urea carboxylase-associated protein 1
MRTVEAAMVIVAEQLVPAGKPWSAIVKRGQRLRVIDIEGEQGVDFLCYSAADPEERYHAANTLKRSKTLLLTTGHALYSDVARPLMTIVDDTCGVHDTIGGCCSAPSNEMLYGVGNVAGCRENFLSELAKYGLGRRDIVANLNFFCSVPVRAGNRLEPLTFAPAPSKPGDYIELCAEMDVIAVISNCPQVNNPCNSGRPTPIKVVVHDA